MDYSEYVARHDLMVFLVERMLALHKHLRGESASREDGTAAARSTRGPAVRADGGRRFGLWRREAG
ncbi:MAG: hypothetical protein WAW52_05525 [Methanothrix sp.]